MNSISYRKSFPKRVREEGLKVLPFEWLFQVYGQCLCVRGCSSSRGGYPSVPQLDHAEQTWRGHQWESDSAAGRYRRQRTRRHKPWLSLWVGYVSDWGYESICMVLFLLGCSF